MVEWIENDEAVLEAAPYDHWNANSKVAQIVFKQVGEQNAMIALMEIGNVDAASILLKSLLRMLDGGFKTADTGLEWHASVVFSDNLWETDHALFGTSLDTAAVYMRDLPRIGNHDPHDSGITYLISDFDEGVLVRNALARAIDRERINQDLLHGLGHAVHLNQFSPNNPKWQRHGSRSRQRRTL